MGRSTFCPALSGFGECLAGRDVLVPMCTSDSCGGPGAVHADMVAGCTVHADTVAGCTVHADTVAGISSDTLVLPG